MDIIDVVIHGIIQGPQDARTQGVQDARTQGVQNAQGTQCIRHEIVETDEFSSIFNCDKNELELLFQIQANEDSGIYSNVAIRISHQDPNLLKLIQIKATHAILVHKRFDIVEYLDRWLSFKEAQGLRVSYILTPKYQGNSDIIYENIESLVILLALREEPRKPKSLQSIEIPSQASQKNPTPQNQGPRIHKVFKR